MGLTAEELQARPQLVDALRESLGGARHLAR
jgi:hypothetical protein